MKILIISLLSVCGAINASSQSMAELFIKMPDEMIVQLEEAWRKDLVDLYKSGKKANLENTMQGQSSLLQLTDDYMLLQSTERSTIELKRLPLVNNTYIICMITTVYAPVADSRVEFYTTEWQSLSADGLFDPVSEAWFPKDDADVSSYGFIDARIGKDMFLAKYSLDADNMNLTAEYTTPQYLDEESRNKIEVFLKDKPKIYEWKRSHFE